MNTNKTEKQIIKSLQTRVKNLAIDRDKLRALKDDVEEYEAAADEAVQALKEVLEMVNINTPNL